MFKNLFDGIVDICKPGIDDPMCQFGISPKIPKKELKSKGLTHELEAVASPGKTIPVWKKVKKFVLVLQRK